MSTSFSNENRKYLEDIDPSFFLNNLLVSFDVSQKNVNNIPLNPEIQQNITRARFISCGLTSIPQGLEQYTRITMLDLTENNITNINENIIQKFESLQNLNLTANNIKNIKAKLPETLITLDLSYNNGLSAEDVWDLDLPALETLKITHCGIKELPEKKPKWLCTLRVLYLDGNFISSLPSYFDEFEFLEEISLFGNAFKEIDTSLLPQEFKLVNLYFNGLTDWEGEDPMNATTLNLNTNSFTTFPIRVLETNGLRALTLANCYIEGVLDVELPSQLAALDLSHNKITELGPKFVSTVSSVSSLILSGNKISKIADNFQEKTIISRLMLDNNEITEIPQSFVNCTRVEQLNLSNNMIEKLPSYSLPHLRILNLSFNNLTELPDCFDASTFLSDFNVAFNKLTKMPHSLCNCRKVVDVNMAGNRLKVFPKCLFSFSQLKTLILSHNELSTIPLSVQSFFFLQTLDLSNNHLTTVPLFISQFISLKILSMSHNLISDFPEGFSIPSSITFLDFSYNKIAKFDFGSNSVQSLNLDCNQIKTFNPDLFTSAKFISINNNPLETEIMQLIMPLASLQNLGAFEMINCGSFQGEIPPLRFHVLSNSHVSDNGKFGIGYSATMGVRPSMEDAIMYHSYDEDKMVFSLFDGHQGNVAAVTSALCLHNEIQNRLNSEEKQEIPQILINSLTEVNKKLKLMNVKDGCTAAASFISGNKCYSIGIGDSRVIRVKKTTEERVTVDFKPTMRTEYERLRRSGFTVSAEGRIGRKLAVARTMGDFWCPSDPNATEGTGTLFVQPEIYEYEIGDEDIALVIACDGVWDVLSDKAVADLARDVASKKGSAQDAATTIRNAAFALGSKDNISTIVVFIHPLDGKEGLSYKNEIETLGPVVEEVDNDQNLNDAPTPSLGRRSTVRRRR